MEGNGNRRLVRVVAVETWGIPPRTSTCSELSSSSCTYPSTRMEKLEMRALTCLHMERVRP
eukprot:2543362-Pyramimonas_sp.AAC.1